MQTDVILSLFGLVTGVSSVGKVRRDGRSQVKLTYYWMAVEADFPVENGSQTTNLQTCNSHQTIKQVSFEYFEEIKMEGSGLLTTGQFANCGDDECNCYEVVEGGAKGNKGNTLQPYASVASVGFPFGTKLFVEKLNGKTLPNGLKHNGCVRVDDTGYTLEQDHIDFFVVSRKNYEALINVLPDDRVTVQINSPCKILDYSKDTPGYAY